MSHLRQRLVAAGICIDCQVRESDGTYRCGVCRARNNRIQRERQQRASRTPKAIFAHTRIKSYTTLKERGLITPKGKKNGLIG